LKLKELQDQMTRCDQSPDSEVVIFVSKIFALPEDALPTIVNPTSPGVAAVATAAPIKKEKFIAFARIFWYRSLSIVYILKWHNQETPKATRPRSALPS
jgi:hypothetical protein